MKTEAPKPTRYVSTTWLVGTAAISPVVTLLIYIMNPAHDDKSYIIGGVVSTCSIFTLSIVVTVALAYDNLMRRLDSLASNQPAAPSSPQPPA